MKEEGSVAVVKQRKEIKREAKKQSSERKYLRDADGRVIINMTVKDDTDFLSVFSTGDTPVISSEVAEFLENSTQSIRSKEQLTLKIHSDCIDDNEKKEYRRAIKEYYTERYIAGNRELKWNTIIVLLLALAGIIALAIAFLIDHQTANPLWTEVVDIIAWVFLWEAVDISAFKNKELRIKKLRYLSYLSMNIEFFNVGR